MGVQGAEFFQQTGFCARNCLKTQIDDKSVQVFMTFEGQFSTLKCQ